MTHRIQITADKETARIGFQGMLDPAALGDVLSCVREARRKGARQITLVLESGTDVCRECIQCLRDAEGLRVEAASPFLANWLRQRDTE